MQKNSKLVLVVAHAVGIIVFGFVSNLLKPPVIDSILIGVISSLYAFAVGREVTSSEFFDLHKSELEKISRTVQNLTILDEIHNLIEMPKHPYFRRWGYNRIRSFIDDNKAFFQGDNYTSHISEDTFGVAGLFYTKDNGTLKCLSSIRDYWEDPRHWMKEGLSHSLQTQQMLIKRHGVSITRVFVLSKQDYSRLYPVMLSQIHLGIHVYYLVTEEVQSISPDWLSQDYLIQDDELLVDLKIRSLANRNDVDKTEHITTNPTLVQERVSRFEDILSRCKRFDRKIVKLESI